MTQLFQPLTLKSITLKNRIAISPMCMYSSEDGFANDWHLVHLGSRAVGGAGLIITEATAVSPEGRISPDDLGIWKDEHLPYLQRITTFLRKHGSVAGMQLAHAGRKSESEGKWTPVAPSAIPFSETYAVPEALTKDGINKVVLDFTAAAKRALSAGFQLIEIHAAHGYLIHEFLSPLSNQRTDEYGGSFENRTRLLREIVASIKIVWPKELPILVRISATDWVDGGWTIDESVRLAKLLKDDGIDLIDCSSGGLHPAQKIPVGPLYQTPFAERIKKEAGILTGAVGMITTADEAESIIRDGRADLVLLARESLRRPYFPLEAARHFNIDAEWPEQYLYAKPSL